MGLKPSTLVQEVQMAMETFWRNRRANGPFHLAVDMNSGPILGYAITKYKKDINLQNLYGETALFEAIFKRRYDIAEKLILAGADVNISNNSKVSPLHIAIWNPKIAELLIKHGADLNSTDRIYRTPLHAAVHYGLIETVHMLLFYNADTNSFDGENNTPFMLALKRRNLEIQEVLFEYVDDYDVTAKDAANYSLLGLALLYQSPYSQEMILRGADVNNVNEFVNGALVLSLYSELNLDIFELIWERMEYQPSKRSILVDLILLRAEKFHKVVDILINSEKCSVITESVYTADDFEKFIKKCIHAGLPIEKFSCVCMKLLSYGYSLTENDLNIIFNCWGYCNIFKNVLYMDIRQNPFITDVNKIPTKLIYNVKYNSKELLNELVNAVEQQCCCLKTDVTLTVLRVLKYFLYPPLIKAYVKMTKTDCVTLMIKALPKVPSLLELAKNETREYIKKSYNVTDSCQLYTLINNLEIPGTFKDILTLETKLYKPTFSESQYQRYIKMLKLALLADEKKKPVFLSRFP